MEDLRASSEIRILTWNVNGLRSALKKNFISFLAKENPDVLCLQETKTYAAVCPDIDHYKVKYFHHSEQKKGYSGTAFFSHWEPKSLQCIDVDAQHPEGRILLSEFSSFYLVNVYVPNAQPELRRLAYRSQVWDVALKNFLTQLKAQKPLIVCGDFNVAHQTIDLARPEANHFSPGFTDEERRGFSAYLEIGLVDVFRHLHPNESGHYTWWSYRARAREKNVGWRIDYFLVSEEILPCVKDCKILNKIEGSDHAPVELVLSLEKAIQ